jgi:hypothetical protein
MRGKRASLLLTALVLTFVVPTTSAAPVPDCPTIDAIEGHTAQCATTPGLMTSTLEVPAGTPFTVTATGIVEGTVRVTNEQGQLVHFVQFLNGATVVWFLGAPRGNVWTSSIELTSGFGAVALDWEL